MPRRALRKVDPALDLSRHFRTLDDLPRPCRSEALFGRAAPVEVEVGSGKGLFLASAAAARPEHDFLGIEVSRKYARYAAARLARSGRDNALVVHADAVRVLREVFDAASLAAVHVYFPDPWWKARHKKRRVMNEVFLRDVERTLAASGELHFWTDVEEYFHTTLELIARTVRLEGPLEVPESRPEHELDYRTHFERRMRLHGRLVYRSLFRKPPGPS